VLRGVTPGANGSYSQCTFARHPTVPILSGASIWPSNADAPRQTAELVATAPMVLPTGEANVKGAAVRDAARSDGTRHRNGLRD